jgi:hypothetical protein
MARRAQGRVLCLWMGEAVDSSQVSILLAFKPVPVSANGDQVLRVLRILFDFLAQQPNIASQDAPTPKTVVSPDRVDDIVL